MKRLLIVLFLITCLLPLFADDYFNPEEASHYNMLFQGQERAFYQLMGKDYLLLELPDFSGIQKGYLTKNPNICVKSKVTYVRSASLELKGCQGKIYFEEDPDNLKKVFDKGDNVWVYAKVKFKGRNSFSLTIIQAHKLPTDQELFEIRKNNLTSGDQKALIDLGKETILQFKKTANEREMTELGIACVLEGVRLKGDYLKKGSHFVGLAKEILESTRNKKAAAEIGIEGAVQFPDDPAVLDFLKKSGFSFYKGKWYPNQERYEIEFSVRFNSIKKGEADKMWALKEWVEENEESFENPEEKMVDCAHRTLKMDPKHGPANRYLNAGSTKAPADSKLKHRAMNIRNGVDMSYTGKYADHKVYLDIIGNIGKIRKNAVETANKNLGFGYEDDLSVILSFDDDKGRKLPTAEAGTALVRGERTEVITFYLEYFISGTADIELVLTHEMIHSIMKSHMKDDFLPLPTWIREGVAVWGSGELKFRTESALATNSMNGVIPVWLINGVETIPHSASDYLEDGLFFQYYSEKYKAKALHTVIQKIMSGEDYKEAFAGVAGVPWERITEDAMRYGRDYLKMMFGTEFSLYKKAGQAYQDGKYTEAQSQYDNLLTDHPDSFLRGVVILRTLSCRFVQRKFQDTHDLAVKWTDEMKKFPYLQPEFKLFLLKCKAVLNKKKEAISLSETLLRDYCYLNNDFVSSIHYWYGFTLIEDKKYREAVVQLNKVLEISRKNEAEVFRLVGIAYFESGNKQMGVDLYNKIKTKYPRVAKSLEKYIE